MSPSSSQNAWSLRADELLKDGEWVEGVTFKREVEKLITPGVAVRQAETNRARLVTRRHGETRERIVERSTSSLVAMGKHSIVVSLVSSRVRFGAWEVEPWPLVEAGWRTGGWKLRDVRRTREALRPITDRARMSRAIVETLMLSEPAVAHCRVGRITYVLDVPELERRIEAHRARSGRCSAEERAESIRRHLEGKQKYSMRNLAEHAGITSRTVRILIAQHPDLPVEPVGQGVYLDVQHLPAWDAIVAEYKCGHSERRSIGAKVSGAKRANVIPSFADSNLNETFRRYVGGEKALREVVYRGMREAFQRADAEAGDG